jgi:hypothetical protein
MFSSKSYLFSPLQEAVNRALIELNAYEVGSEEYLRGIDSLAKLHKLKEEEKTKPVSKDTLVVAATNILGILIIIKHEHVNIITSKAFNMLLRAQR